MLVFVDITSLFIPANRAAVRATRKAQPGSTPEYMVADARHEQNEVMYNFIPIHTIKVLTPTLEILLLIVRWNFVALTFRVLMVFGAACAIS